MNQKVDPDQIKGLANHMERLRMGIGESTAKVYRDISQLIRDTRSAYSESSVQAAANEVDRLLQEIWKLSQSIDDRLGSKAKTLRRVAQDYVRVEKEAEQKIQSAMKTVQLRAGNSVDLTKRVQKVVKVKTVESLDDVKPNDANLKMLLRQFLDEFGYEVMPGEVSVDITMDEHVLDFWEFALAKGYDPVTYDYLEYWERSEAYRRLEEKINELRSAQESYKESMLDGYEVLAFGKGFYIGLDNSVNNIADKLAEIVSHPVASGEALLQGIKQVYINLNEEAGKFSKDPLSYIRNAAVNKWTSLKDVYVELQELKPSQRWERIGGMVGENIIAAATSAVGGGIVGAGLKKVFIIIESKIDINIPIKDIDKITGNETKPPSELQSPDVTKPPKAVEAPQTPEVNKSAEGTGNTVPVIKNNFAYIDSFADHMINAQGIVRKGNKGVVGGHNLESFEKILTDQGWNLDDVIVSRTPHPTVTGVYEIEYRLPALDRELKVVPGQYKNIPQPKTVYDSNLISNEQMIVWGKEAMENGVINGRLVIGYSSNGLRFTGYLDDSGNITNFHPSFEGN